MTLLYYKYINNLKRLVDKKINALEKKHIITNKEASNLRKLTKVRKNNIRENKPTTSRNIAKESFFEAKNLLEQAIQRSLGFEMLLK